MAAPLLRMVGVGRQRRLSQEPDDTEEGGTPIYDLSKHSWGMTEEWSFSTALLVFSIIFGLATILSFYSTHVRGCTLFPEAGIVLLVGIVAGGFAVLLDPDGAVGASLVNFSPTMFFVMLLPPIIFQSGYTVHKRHFFSNIRGIGAFALVGTFFSAIFIGCMLYFLSQIGALSPRDLDLSECLTFGALISATDPVSTLAVFAELSVDPNLFYLVFGESVINDAVGVVLFNTFSKFVGYKHGVGTVFIAIADFLIIFLGSVVVGYLVGCLAGAVTKYVHFRDHRVIEMSAYMVLMYLPYLLAEAVEMSGIVATLFAGISVRHYAHSNLSPESQDLAKFLFKMAAYVTETAVFLDLGLSVFRLDYFKAYHCSLIVWAVVLCLVSRALHIYPLSYWLNRTRKESDGVIEPKKQNMLWFAGLRGAVAFACAQVFPDANGHREAFLVTTMVIVLLTVFTMGSATVPVLKYLDIQIGVDHDAFQAPAPSQKAMSFVEFDRRNMQRWFSRQIFQRQRSLDLDRQSFASEGSDSPVSSSRMRAPRLVNQSTERAVVAEEMSPMTMKMDVEDDVDGV